MGTGWRLPRRKLRKRRHTSAGRGRISIVDDDSSIPRSAKRSHAILFTVSTRKPSHRRKSFLASGSLHRTDCLILDVRLPGISGLDLQERLNSERCAVPVIFISANVDDLSRQRALKGRGDRIPGEARAPRTFIPSHSSSNSGQLDPPFSTDKLKVGMSYQERISLPGSCCLRCCLASSNQTRFDWSKRLCWKPFIWTVTASPQA